MNRRNHQQTNHGFRQSIHLLICSANLGTCYVPGPVHSGHKDLLSIYYVPGMVNRTHLISGFSELGDPGICSG